MAVIAAPDLAVRYERTRALRSDLESRLNHAAFDEDQQDRLGLLLWRVRALEGELWRAANPWDD